LFWPFIVLQAPTSTLNNYSSLFNVNILISCILHSWTKSSYKIQHPSSSSNVPPTTNISSRPYQRAECQDNSSLIMQHYHTLKRLTILVQKYRTSFRKTGFVDKKNVFCLAVSLWDSISDVISRDNNYYFRFALDWMGFFLPCLQENLKMTNRAFFAICVFFISFLDMGSLIEGELDIYRNYCWNGDKFKDSV